MTKYVALTEQSGETLCNTKILCNTKDILSGPVAWLRPSPGQTRTRCIWRGSPRRYFKVLRSFFSLREVQGQMPATAAAVGNKESKGVDGAKRGDWQRGTTQRAAKARMRACSRGRSRQASTFFLQRPRLELCFEPVPCDLLRACPVQQPRLAGILRL